MPPPTIKTRTEGTVVPPRSKKVIAANAHAMRQFLNLEKQDYFPVAAVYATLNMMFDGADFEVFEDYEMGEDHGRTYPDQLLIVLRNSVYERACGGEARDRFTMCHELGHLMMHRGIALSRVDPNLPPKIYCNSEWQADTFASYLMMPPDLVCRFRSVAEVVSAFGVSYEAAFARRSELIGKNV
jgi:hypothetical protein